MNSEMTVARPLTGPAIVVAEHAGHTYGSGLKAVVAVHDANCQVHWGDRVALIGPSGSGKSTLLHMLAGLELATSGKIAWPGRKSSPTGRPDLVGVVFQAPSLVPSLNALENVAFPLILSGIPHDDATARATAALNRLDLLDLKHRLPDELSGGQAQRIAVARVLASRPRLILADEPTGQLDHRAGRRVMDVLIEAADEAEAALVVTTHDPEVAVRLTTHWFMSDGALDVGTRTLQGRNS